MSHGLDIRWIVSHPGKTRLCSNPLDIEKLDIVTFVITSGCGTCNREFLSFPPAIQCVCVCACVGEMERILLWLQPTQKNIYLIVSHPIEVS